MKNLIGFVIIVITLLALFGNAIDVFASPQLVKTEGLYACLAQSENTPKQDGNYPPEGYHCRTKNGNSETVKKQDDKQAETVITETIEPETVVIIEPETIEPETCKNKNSGKDNTPNECNAGIGQEKNGG